ncbi:MULTISPECIES: hypothetical protein [Haematobacter]|nr:MULTISPECIES: hypothetical protein [Haematobacter]OWJ74423.1 hypothetical protein CDV49_19445 [Haematobacter genomosp. 1]
MNLMKTALIAAFATITTLNVTGAAQAKDLPKWVCDGGGSGEPQKIREFAHNNGMVNVLSHYRDRWDADFAREQCDAAAAGESAYIGCMIGHRDWDAIAAMVPSELWGLDNKGIRPHLLKLQDEGTGYRDALNHCRELGVSR